MVDSVSLVRTFICLELPREIKAGIAELQDDLKSVGRGVRWSRPDGIHLTLKFLGDIKSNMIENIAEQVAAACKACSPFSIEIAQTGAFPNFRRPRVFWLGVHEKTGNLSGLKKSIDNRLQEIGFPKESRAFSPHLTIGRIKSSDDVDVICRAFQKAYFEPMSFDADEVIVMQSRLRPTGSAYTPLRIIKLE